MSNSMIPSPAASGTPRRLRSLVLAAVMTATVTLSACGSERPGSLGEPTSLPGAPTTTPAVPLVTTQDATSTCSDSVGTDGIVREAGGLPDLTLPCLDGSGDVSLAALRGPLVMTIWASWCVPCRKELPAFADVHERSVRHDADVRFIGLNWLDDSSSAVAFAEEIGFTFPSVFDPDGTARGPLRINAQPATLFIDADGVIVHVERAPIDDPDALASLIDQHLGVRIPA